MFVSLSISTVLCYNTEWILILLGINEENASIAAEFVILSIPYCWFNMYNSATIRYLNANKIFLPQMWIEIVGVIIGITSNNLIVPHFGWTGVAITNGIVLGFDLFALIIYIKVSGCVKESWIPWTLEALKEWPKYFKETLSITGIDLV